MCELDRPNFFYVGTTTREAHHREREHREGHGCQWTRRHGFKRMMFAQLIEPGTGSRLEDDLTIALMSRFGWGAVRGGNLVATNEAALRQFLPNALKDLAPTDVLPLHLRPVSKFATELRRLVDAFKFSSRFHHPNELNTDPFAEPVLGGLPQEEHHVFPAHPAPVALRAQ